MLYQTCKGLWRKNVNSKQHDENVIGDDYLNMLYVWTYTNDHAFY